MLCLVGGQGAGKSSFFRLLAVNDDWFSDDLKKLDDENVYRKMQGHWIIEMSEMIATANAKSIEEIKSFLSRQKETYKIPYETHPADRKRQCVFGGSSNTLDFLPLDRTGNRRFVPVMVYPERAEVHILADEQASREYINQMWAEAMEIYRSGNFRLRFSPAMNAYLKAHQKDFMPEDTKAGQILDYLERYSGSIVCSKQLYKEALGHDYDEPKQWELREINDIMNNAVTGWRAFSNPRYFPEPYRRQKGWERIRNDNEPDNSMDGFQEIPTEEMEQLGLPGIDERQMMVDTVKALQSVVDVPLQLDSTIPEVLDAALRVYNGKPIVNSVNGEEDSLNNILPIVKKYGAAVIGLALDKDGIPKKAEDRVAIARKIMDRAIAIGIPKEDIYIDCLTLTASAEQEGVMETLNALYEVKHTLGLRTVLGVSNISFGLPNRVLVNHIFLTMAMQNGLDLAIINPNIYEMMGAVRAYKLLANIDKNSVDYIKAYASMPNISKINPMNTAANAVQGGQTAQAGGSVNLKDKKGSYTCDDLFYAVEKGLKNEGAAITEELLAGMDSMDIVNNALIPALDKIGEEFEKGTLFLPQLIMAAGVAQGAFEVIRKHMIMSNNAPVSKGKIVIATVKGDVHDIGKNIVKVLLENYGYEVIDLGKDVEYQVVVDAIKENGAKLCGLSALMTTTLVSMKKTIELIHKNNLDCKVMVGGAVLTPEYAKEIHADFYSKDAKESVDIAKRVLG